MIAVGDNSNFAIITDAVAEKMDLVESKHVIVNQRKMYLLHNGADLSARNEIKEILRRQEKCSIWENLAFVR